MVGCEREFNKLNAEDQERAVLILAERLSGSDEVRTLLTKHGYQYVDGTFVPIELLDAREARYLPASSSSELAKAMKRLTDGDESGAITAACGAVDALMQRLYQAHALGDPATVAFAAKVNTALQRLQVFEGMTDELVDLGMKREDAIFLVNDLRRATNHAAQSLQTLRRVMGDVHGTKPSLRRMAYDAIKWASAICGLFEGK